MTYRTKNWFGGPMSAVVYDIFEPAIDTNMVLIEVRNDKPMPLEGVPIIEVLHSKPEDSEEDFIARVMQFARERA